MPPKGKGKKGKGKGKGNGDSKKTKSTVPNPTPHLYFPKEIICKILSRLPVKTLLRFSCVCKQWRNLISKPNFIADHFRHSSSLQHSGSSLLIGSRHHKSNNHILSLYKPPEPVVDLENNPYPCFFPNMYIVGPCNGIACLFNPPWGDVITLWNPAMRQSRMVELSEREPIQGVHGWVSVGLAFDSKENEMLILRIFCVGLTSPVPNHVEMFSTKSLKWKELKNDMVFSIVEYTCNVIVKGVPYWLVCMIDKFGARAVCVRFDVGKKVFEKLPWLGRCKQHQHLVDLEDSLCMLDCSHKDNCHIDVWVMNDEDGWSKKCTVGPLLGFDRIEGCLRNGDIVARNENGVIFLCDPITSSVKAKFSLDNSKNDSNVIVDYSESLFLIRGMLPVKKQNAQDNLARKKLTRACLKFIIGQPSTISL
ncbi:F-box/kelch-repeat protein At3g23880-like isoform X2 [Lycium barbarum]|uniref:F-box/kelch-repeat protein At3g23880-like isoform X2 n=1 Tax=Lycium barbarum TaxID=112863 RepID=UPI00293F0056|nr:F-box/kelch-repeat protein At3g23880-like isoform X2 [Lycium barbarum]